MPAVMVQGTGSGVGKSLLVAGLCRAARRRGINVAPFKPQNMSNNAAVTADGGEIGRAQALQARAAGLVAHSDMNPVLLKPHSATGAQVVVQGQVRGDLMARDYARRRDGLLAAVMESYCRLQSRHDLIIVEGAGSPAEINLRAGDIANMGFARAAGVPVVLAGDIDRGGVIAQIVGTKAVLDPSDAAMIRGLSSTAFAGMCGCLMRAMTPLPRKRGGAVMAWSRGLTRPGGCLPKTGKTCLPPRRRARRRRGAACALPC